MFSSDGKWICDMGGRRSSSILPKKLSIMARWNEPSQSPGAVLAVLVGILVHVERVDVMQGQPRAR